MEEDVAEEGEGEEVGNEEGEVAVDVRGVVNGEEVGRRRR